MKREELVSAVEDLNRSGLAGVVVNSKTAKLSILEELFLDAVDTIPRSKEKEIPKSVISAYNTLVDQDTKEEVVPEVIEEPKVEVPKPEKQEVKQGESDFDAVKKSILQGKDKKLTSLMDFLLLEPTTPEEIFATIKEVVEKKKLKTFGSIQTVKQHITTRKKQGWVFAEEGEKIYLTGVNW